MKLKRKLKKIKTGGNKEIVPWVERLSYFNQYFSDHTTETEVLHYNEHTIAMKGVVKSPEGNVIADGIAHKKISEPFSYQKCQSGALNRALFIFGIFESDEDSIMDEDDASELQKVSNDVYSAMVNHLDIDYSYVEERMPMYKKQFTTQQIANLQKEINKRKSEKAVQQASK